MTMQHKSNRQYISTEPDLLAFDRDKYKKFFELSVDALSILDVQSGTFIECNQGAIEMHGVESEENFLDLTPAQLSPKHQPCGGLSEELAIFHIEKTLVEGAHFFHWTHQRLDGSTFPALVSLTAISLNEKRYILGIGRDISELENTNLLLKLISDNNQDYLLAKDSQFRIVYANPAFLSLYPAEKRDKVIGYTTLEEYDSEEADAFLAQDKIAFEQGHAENLEQIDFPNGERRILHTRKIRFFDSHNNPFILAVARDVTEREELVSALSSANQELERLNKRNQSVLAEKQAILDAMLDSLVVIDKRGRIEDVNKTTEALFGYGKDELIGKNVSCLMNTDDAEQHDLYLSNYSESGNAQIIGRGREVVARKKSGQLFHAFLSIAQCVEHGDVKYVGTMRDVSHEVHKRLDLEYHAMHDPLTGLLTRRMLAQKIEDAISEALREGRVFSLFYLDLNKFKPINDEHGHKAGDEVLQIIAKRLSNALRESDVCARVGGDEFVILCQPDVAMADEATIRSKIESVIDSPIQLGDVLLSVSVSIGVASFPADGDTIDILLNTADRNMYREKKGTRHANR